MGFYQLSGLPLTLINGVVGRNILTKDCTELFYNYLPCVAAVQSKRLLDVLVSFFCTIIFFLLLGNNDIIKYENVYIQPCLEREKTWTVAFIVLYRWRFPWKLRSINFYRFVCRFCLNIITYKYVWQLSWQHVLTIIARFHPDSIRNSIFFPPTPYINRNLARKPALQWSIEFDWSA